MTYQIPVLRVASIINIFFSSFSHLLPLLKIRTGIQLSLEVCFPVFPLQFRGKQDLTAWSAPGRTPSQEPR